MCDHEELYRRAAKMRQARVYPQGLEHNLTPEERQEAIEIAGFNPDEDFDAQIDLLFEGILHYAQEETVRAERRAIKTVFWTIFAMIMVMAGSLFTYIICESLTRMTQ